MLEYGAPALLQPVRASAVPLVKLPVPTLTITRVMPTINRELVQAREPVAAPAAPPPPVSYDPVMAIRRPPTEEKAPETKAAPVQVFQPVLFVKAAEPARPAPQEAVISKPAPPPAPPVETPAAEPVYVQARPITAERATYSPALFVPEAAPTPTYAPPPVFVPIAPNPNRNTPTGMPAPSRVAPPAPAAPARSSVSQAATTEGGGGGGLLLLALGVGLVLTGKKKR